MGTNCVTVWRPLTKLLHWEGSQTRPTIWMAITVLQWCDVIVGWKVQHITVSLCRWCYNELSRPSISRLDWRRCSRGCWEFDSSAVVVMAEAAGAAGSCWCRGTMPELPAALLYLFSIGHKLTHPPPKHTHPPHTHTHTRSASRAFVWRVHIHLSCMAALALTGCYCCLFSRPFSRDAATVWGNCWS